MSRAVLSYFQSGYSYCLTDVKISVHLGLGVTSRYFKVGLYTGMYMKQACMAYCSVSNSEKDMFSFTLSFTIPILITHIRAPREIIMFILAIRPQACFKL